MSWATTRPVTYLFFINVLEVRIVITMTTIRTEDIGLILAQGEPVAGVARAVTGNQSGQRWRGETQVAGAFKQHSNTDIKRINNALSTK